MLREGLEFALEEVSDCAEELGVVAVVVVGREVGERVRAGKDGLQVAVGEFRGRLEFGCDVAREVEVALDDGSR